MIRAIVAGAGIGGLATSIALRPKNIDVVILERAPDLSSIELGAGITLWPNAMLVLDRLGVGAAVREQGATMGWFEQRRIPRAAKFQRMVWALARAAALTRPPAPQVRNTAFALTSPIAWRMQAKDMVIPAP